MAISNQSWLSNNFFINFDVKYCVHIELLISRTNFYFTHIIQWYTDVFHLFCNWLGTKVTFRFPVNIICLFYCHIDLYPKLMWYASILGFHLGNNPILGAQSIFNPPYDGRFINYFICHGIFRQFNWVVLFKVIWWNPINWSVLTFNWEFHM